MKGKVLHREIHDVLRGRILKGLYGSSGKLPTEAQLMEEFHVSRITVMRAARDLQQEGLIYRKQGAGTFVKVSKENRLRLGIMTQEPLPSFESNSNLPAIQQNLAQEATKLGIQVLLGYLQMPDESDPLTWATVEVAQQLVSNGANGAIFSPLPFDVRWNSSNLNILTAFKAARVEVVLLGRDVAQYPEQSKWDVVRMDEINAGYQIGSYLIVRGCRKLSFVSLKGVFPRLGLMGIGQALQEHDAELTGKLVWSQDGLERVAQMIRQQQCDGIVCENDIAAQRVISDLIAAGVQIAGQLRIGSLDHLSVAQPIPVPLISFAQPIEGIARAAISALVERKRSPSLPPRSIQIEGRLLVRKPSRT